MIVGAVALGFSLVASSSAVADREFEARFSKNVGGDIVMAANAVLSCDGSQAGCDDARDGKAGAQLGNNAWAMRYVDVDSDPNTFDSSRAQVLLPAGATVLFAGLYWGANPDRGQGGLSARARRLPVAW